MKENRRILPKAVDNILLAVLDSCVCPEYDCMCSVFRCLLYSPNPVISIEETSNSQCGCQSALM